MEIRQGFIGIIVRRKDHIEEVNHLLTRFGCVIRGRIGIPSQKDETAVIGLVVEGTNDQIGALTGKLGNIGGIVVKSALAPKDDEKERKQEK